jgi:site-specific DNA recombinase
MHELKSGAVVYTRVAVADHEALLHQERDCREYCEHEGWPVARVFTDSGASGLTVDRPGFQQLLDYCRANQQDIHHVVVRDFARIARSPRLCFDTIQGLEQTGIMVHVTERRRGEK